MKRFPFTRVGLLATLMAATALAEQSATNAITRGGHFPKHHAEYVAIAKKGGVDLLFLGDSITRAWTTPRGNLELWNQIYGPRHAANFGMSGDRTQNLLWRITNGELEGIKPKVVVLMIGTNNTGNEKDGKTVRNSTPDIIAGITAIVNELRARLPESKVLLLGIFPRGEKDDPQRAQVAEINASIAKLDDDKHVKFLDIGDKFLEPDGTLSRDIMPDLLHPNAKGYQIWADAMEPTLAAMMK